MSDPRLEKLERERIEIENEQRLTGRLSDTARTRLEQMREEALRIWLELGGGV